tara:strand:- start:821 stop:2059 length:1239 start_codon:yes stop_codon:yes gene_type:complete
MMSEIRDAKILSAAIKYTEKKIANLKEDLILPTLIEGPQGDPGTKGDRGERGEPGESGRIIVESNGPIGPKGETGSTGLSIKEAKIANGKLHLIREDDQIFTAGDVVGPRGGQGVPGKQGELGDKGDRGLLGEQGIIGPQGLVGAKGAKGDKGDKGDQGLKGFVGLQGETGPIGLKGDTGNTGAAGAKGDKGDKGDPGLIGPQGPDGAIGPQGLSGRDANEIDVATIKKTFEDDITGFKNKISTQVSRLAMSSGGGGEVWLHRLNDVDYNSTKSPSNGQTLVYSTSKGKWEAGTSASGLTIKEEGTTVGATVDEINFIGATVTASGNNTQITINSNPDSYYAANTYVNILLSNTNTSIASKISYANVAITSNASSITTTQDDVALNDKALVNPDGFLTLNISGTNYKLPYFS